jgi:hypothetical protein
MDDRPRYDIQRRPLDVGNARSNAVKDWPLASLGVEFENINYIFGWTIAS